MVNFVLSKEGGRKWILKGKELYVFDLENDCSFLL
jgi:hypothetical protein